MRSLSIFAGTLFLTSCVFSNEGIPKTLPTSEGMAEVSFMAEMPTPTVVATRSMGSAPENKVDNIYVLVFETGTDGKLVYKGKGKNLAVASGATNDNKVTFKATLPVGTAYDFMVLANTEAALSGINVSNTPASRRSDVEKLTQTLAAGAKWNASHSTMTPIPMWGELKNRTFAADAAATFPLTRMLARVNVEYNPTNTAVENFKLTSVRVYNYSRSGALVPKSFDVDGVTAKNATAPYSGYGTETGNALLYDGTAITGNKSCQNLIYLFEAAHNGSTYRLPAGNSDWIDNPCLVVGGRYSADGTNWSAAETYYRVDFIRKTVGGTTPTEEWLSLLRNFSYNVTITEVGGEGYDTPDTALNSAPLNMEANILSWNERDMGKVVFDGVFYLSVSRDEFVFQRRGVTGLMSDGANTVKIKTDYMVNRDPADAGSGWRVDRIEDLGGNPVSWLKLVPNTRPTGWRPNDVDYAYFTFETNSGTTDREADVWIKAGRLEYKIHVVQKILSLDILDENDNPISEMFFVINDGGSDGSERHDFRVDWTPSDRPVYITNESPVVYNPFAPAWVSGNPTLPGPTPGANTRVIPAQPGNTVGSVTYIVQPAAVDAGEFTTDPFYEKESNYKFKIVNGADEIEKSINLHLIHYALRVDANKYRLDGGTHTISARSNAEWKITKVEEWLYNVDPLTLPEVQRPASPVMLKLKAYDNLKTGTVGGPDINGKALAFTVVNNEAGIHNGKWGTVYVTFESVSVPAKFPPQRVAIPFPPATKLVLGIGYTNDVRSNNVAFGTAFHLNSAYRMLSSPYNFGSMKESVYQVEGLRLLGYSANGTSAATVPVNNPDFEWHINSLKNWLNNHDPDVIVVSSFQTLAPIFNKNECLLLKEYLENGGALIMMYNAGHSVASNHMDLSVFMNAVFGQIGSNTSTTDGMQVGDFTHNYDNIGGENNTDVRTWTIAPASGGVFKLKEGVEYADDPILNGPFGDIRGKHWGAHYYRGGIKTSIIAPYATTLSTAKDVQAARIGGGGHDDYSIIWRHNKYNLLYIGQDAFVSSYYDYYQTIERHHDPFFLDKDRNYYPIARPNFQAILGYYPPVSDPDPVYDVYNSVLFANAMAWALTVTNHIPPAGGY